MSNEKPEIPDTMMAKWQRVVDLSAELMEVPASLIMQTEPPDHSVLVSSRSDGNPYRVGQSYVLDSTLYCYDVLERRDELIVRDAFTDPNWSDNQDLEHGMSFYVGYPLTWPDGALFGTICILDTHNNEKALTHRELLMACREVIEGDLELLVEVTKRREAEQELHAALEHLEQRVANRTRALTEANEELQREVENRRKVEAALLNRERELEEANTALRVLLSNVETSRVEYEEKILRQIRGLVLPHITKLRMGISEDDPASAYLDLLESNLGKLTSSLASRLATAFEILTPAEAEIAQLVLNGQTTKDIAKTLSRETSTIDFHRNNIRKKLGIDRRKVNLRSHLLSLQ